MLQSHEGSQGMACCCRDLPGYYTTTRRDVVLDAPETVATWKLPHPAELRTRGPLIQLDGVCYAYPPAAPAGQSASDQGSPAAEPQPAGSGLATAKRKWLLAKVTMCIEQVCT